jgi:flagellar motor protein MotB
MTRDEFRAHRFANTWLGTALATFVGIGSTVELAAMPIPAPGAQLLEPTLVQQSPGPDTQQPGRAPSGDASGPDAFIELREALTAARERLSRAAEAVAATGQLQQERAALREENQQLRAESEALTKTVKQAAAKAREMQQELAAVRQQSEQRIAAADRARTEAEARLSEMRDSLERAEREKVGIDADLARVQRELTTAKEQVVAAGQEHAQLGQRTAALEKERDDLHTRLADATARLGRSETANAQLESEVAALREAARAAADETRELIKALAAIGPAAGPLETDVAPRPESGTSSAGAQADAEGRAATAPVENVAALAAPGQGPDSGSADADLQRATTATAMRRSEVEGTHLDERGILGGVPAVLALADLPLQKRQRVQGLLADLNSKLDGRGLMTTVPGELLFAVGSDEVQAGAGDTLAKVAELIGMYDDRQVLIIGHSDARGDAARNRQLSERRAELVKRIFVDYFGLAADRLSTEGLGEARPIASNATSQGRSANRRVEILILN